MESDDDFETVRVPHPAPKKKRGRGQALLWDKVCECSSERDVDQWLQSDEWKWVKYRCHQTNGGKVKYFKCKEAINGCKAQIRLRYHSESVDVSVESSGEHAHTEQDHNEDEGRKRGLSDGAKKVRGKCTYGKGPNPEQQDLMPNNFFKLIFAEITLLFAKLLVRILGNCPCPYYGQLNRINSEIRRS